MRRLSLLTLLALALAAPAAAASPLRKLDGRLKPLVSEREPAHGSVRQPAVVTPDGMVAVDVYADGDLEAAARSLRRLGMRVTAIGRQAPQRIVEGELPVRALTDAASLGRVRALVAVEGTGTNTGSVTSQGDAAHHGPQARLLGPSGAGVVVGVISDSMNNVGTGVAGSQGTGNLPADVQVLQDDVAGADEGRAMAEIVYDTAPGVPRMIFHTGTEGAVNKAQGIDQLVAAGAKVIADDTFLITEPFFQDGVIAQAVDRAKAAGVTYVVSAGNRARQSWEGTYSGGPVHDFGGGDAAQRLGTFTDDNLFLELQWDEPWGAATTDLAIDVYNLGTSSTVPAFSTTTDNIATGLPSEFTPINITGTVNLGIGIRRVAGARNPFMKYIVGGGPTFTIAEHNVFAGAIDPDASSALGAITTAASRHSSPATAESYSSRGPTTRLFDVAGNRLAAPDVRNKPDLSGADGVATSVSGFGTFNGTSAAAPSVAGVAALVRSADPSLSPDGVGAILRTPANTIDCTSAAGLPDLDCGFGFPLADKAVSMALDASPPAIGKTVSPAAPNGANGFYTSDVNVSWTISDPESPIFSATGCGASTVNTDGTRTLTCTASSAGGTSTVSETVKRDASPPSAPAITGIRAQRYAASRVPAAACTSADPTSGATCTVAGRSAAKGAHTLTATAVNGAGLTSSSSLAYRVVAAVTRLTVSRKKLVYRLDAPAKVKITISKRVKNKFRTVRRLKQTGRRGKNVKKLPALGPGRYRVKVAPSGGFAKTRAFKRR